LCIAEKIYGNIFREKTVYFLSPRFRIKNDANMDVENGRDIAN